MKETSGNNLPVVRISRYSIQCLHPSSRGNRRKTESTRWTFYGVDEEGAERIYAEHNTEEEYKAWIETDPLWHEEQHALIKRLLDNPGARDTVIKINVAAAINKGDIGTAAELAQHLSPGALSKLTYR